MARFTSDYPIFFVTVDMAILTVHADQLQVLMVKRRHDPFAGKLALPGGFVDPGEDLHEAARRELQEETGVTDVVFEQLASYGAPDRDPRGRIVSVAHLAILPEPVSARAGDDASEAGWHPVEPLLRSRSRLGFDHKLILRDAVERVRTKLERTTLATSFMAKEFTLSDLRSVYEVVWGHPLDPGNFQRKVTKTEDFITETGRMRPSQGPGRPAGLFRARRPGIHPLSIPIARPQ